MKFEKYLIQWGEWIWFRFSTFQRRASGSRGFNAGVAASNLHIAVKMLPIGVREGTIVAACKLLVCCQTAVNISAATLLRNCCLLAIQNGSDLTNISVEISGAEQKV